MFHYIKYRPTSVIKKHSSPSEKEFFLTNRVTSITPPHQRQKTVPRLSDHQLHIYQQIIYPRQFCEKTISKKSPQDDFFWLAADFTRGRIFSRVPDITRSRKPDFFGSRRHQEMIARGSRRHLRCPFPGQTYPKNLNFLQQKISRTRRCPTTSFCGKFMKAFFASEKLKNILYGSVAKNLYESNFTS